MKPFLFQFVRVSGVGSLSTRPSLERALSSVNISLHIFHVMSSRVRGVLVFSCEVIFVTAR